MKKKGILFILFFLAIALTGCSNTEKKYHVYFSKEKFKVDVSGTVAIEGRVSGLSKGDYKANIDRENQIIHLDSSGKFEIDSFIRNSSQKIFPIGIETPSKQIIVGSASLDTKDFSKALELKNTVFPKEIVESFREATLTVENDRNIQAGEFPFKFWEGITFSDGTTKVNSNVKIFSFKKSTDFEKAKEFFSNESEQLKIQNDIQINRNLFQREISKEESPLIDDAVFKNILLNYEKEHEIAQGNPLYHSKVSYYQDKNIILVCENGISNTQFELYQQVINDFKKK